MRIIIACLLMVLSTNAITISLNPLRVTATASSTLDADSENETDNISEFIAISEQIIPLAAIDLCSAAICRTFTIPWWWTLITAGTVILILLVLWHRCVIAYHADIESKPYFVFHHRGCRAEEPDVFAKPGYEIEGWYTSYHFEDKERFCFERRVFLRKRLYANWVISTEENEY